MGGEKEEGDGEESEEESARNRHPLCVDICYHMCV